MELKELAELRKKCKSCKVRIIDIVERVGEPAGTVSGRLYGYAPAPSGFISKVEELIREREAAGIKKVVYEENVKGQIDSKAYGV